MIDNPFFNEAVEGLQHADPKRVSTNVDEINAALRKYLKHRKVRREKYFFQVNMWTYVAVFFVLILAVVVYLILHYMR
jgi:hypothetical protein